MCSFNNSENILAICAFEHADMSLMLSRNFYLYQQRCLFPELLLSYSFVSKFSLPAAIRLEVGGKVLASWLVGPGMFCSMSFRAHILQKRLT